VVGEVRAGPGLFLGPEGGPVHGSAFQFKFGLHNKFSPLSPADWQTRRPSVCPHRFDWLRSGNEDGSSRVFKRRHTKRLSLRSGRGQDTNN